MKIQYVKNGKGADKFGTCIECGKEFSDRAEACPNCGCPTSETTGKKSNISVAKNMSKRRFFLQ